MRFRILRSLLIIFVLIITFLVAVSLLIRTDMVQQKLVGIIKETVSRKTGQEFSIGRVDFNVINGVIITDLELKIEGQDFISIGTVEIGYPLELSNIIKQLAQKNISINNLKISGLYLRLQKQDNGRWNYSALQKAKKKKEKTSESKSGGQAWIVKIADAELYESQIELRTGTDKPARLINVSNINTSLYLNTSGKTKVNIRDGNISEKPDNISINDLIAKLKIDKQVLVIEPLSFKLNGAPVNLSASIAPDNGNANKKFSIKSEIKGFKFEKGLVNFKLNGEGEFTGPENIEGRFGLKVDNSEYMGNKFSFDSGDITIKKSNLQINNATLVGDLGKATLNFSTDLKKLSDKKANNDFKFSLKTEGIKYSELIQYAKLEKSGDITKKDILLDADLKADGYFNEKKNFEMNADIANISLSGAAGDVVLSGQTTLNDNGIKSKLTGNTSNLDLKYFLDNPDLASSINSKIKIDAEFPISFDVKKASGNIDVQILQSTLMGKKIRNGKIYTDFKDQDVKNTMVNLDSDFLKFEVTGGTENNELNFAYNLESDDIGFVNDFKPGLDLSGSLSTSGTIRGDISNPVIYYSLKANDNKFKSVEVDDVDSGGTVKIGKNLISAESDGKLKNLVISNKRFSGLNYDLKSDGKDILCKVNLIKDENNDIETEFRLEDIKEKKIAEFYKLLINFDGLNYSNASPFYINFKDGVKIEGLNLQNADSTLRINFTKKLNLIDSDVSIEQFNFETLDKFMGLEEPLFGVLSGKFSSSGSPQNIKFSTDLKIDSFKYRDFESQSILIQASYLKPDLSVNIRSRQGGLDTLILTGRIKADLNLETFGDSIKNSQLDLTLNSVNLNLSPVSKFTGAIDEINGYLKSRLDIKGKVNAPLLYGDITLNNIEIKPSILNNKLTLKTGVINFDGTEAEIKELVVASGEGKGVINGKLDIRDLNYNIKTKLDQLTIKPRTVKTNVSGDINLTGEKKRMNIAGSIKLNKTRVSIKDRKKQKVSEIKFVNGDKEESDEIVIKDKKQSNYYRDDVSMDMTVKIANNTWVRGKGANVEVKGNMKIKKDYQDDMILTGNISTVRGTYKIFGKLFKIQKGNVNFPGIREINPLLDITALYHVSDVNVFVDIGGDVETPKINLRSDPALQENDIISYLLFGSPADKLGTGERSSLNQVAAGIAGGAVLNEFKGVLGEEFSPDVLSFGTGEAGPELEVGKYLSDDLYVAYERKTSTDASTPIPTDNVKVEYRLFDYLSVASEVGSEQAGGDVFFNFDF